jgi:hypothetical protein
MMRENSKDLYGKTERNEYIIGDLLQKIRNDSIVLPAFQRGFVWTLQKIIIENWFNIKRAINCTCKYLNEVGITDKKTLSSYTSIIPIIYSIYNNDGEVRNKNDISNVKRTGK